ELTEALAPLKVALVHGRIRPDDRDRVMLDFKAGKIDVLVATTVIEVGVDVPNASFMIIENAERMGLAQLHQLRGRVGRGQKKSSCVLLYKPPLTATARERVAVLRRTDDGFEVARKDLELRGAGELLGTRQTGLMNMRVADLVRDAHLVGAVQRTAEILQREYPQVVTPLVRRWLGDDSVRYGKV
ncbi:MAG: ATP-dependent DNA helicase RecG, partial [Gammaproteobacteria bacterium]|nr:ATP-dependent DNA helicase RecG [Gammaproteobacteria bacterium]